LRSWPWKCVAVLLGAAALRLLAFGQVPPGLYHDEAYHGLDALELLAGNLSFYFPANNGREPLFIYLIGLTVGLLGRSPFALRLAAVSAGLLTVAATAALGRALFSQRVGLLASAILALTLWHVHLSRVGFRAVLLPLFLSLSALLAARAGRTGRRSLWAGAGLLYGLSFYTYTASRFTPVALLTFGLYALVVLTAAGRHRSTLLAGVLPGLVVAALAALVAVAPLGIFTLGHADVVLGRPGQVSVFNPDIHGGALWSTLGQHLLRTAGMFFVRGDRIWRHNVPWRPVFDPALGVAFVLGLFVALRRSQRNLAAGLVLIWTALMAVPTLLAEDAPHFLRAAGMLPAVVFLPALGLDAIAGMRPKRWAHLPVTPAMRSGLRQLLIAAVLVVALTSTTWSYFFVYAREPMAGYWFEDAAVTLAGRVNRFLGRGWDGERMLTGDLPPAPGRVYLDEGLWSNWPQVRFLVAAPQAVTVGLSASPAPAPSPAARVAVFVSPHGDWRRAWTFLPSPAEIGVEVGPLSQADCAPEPYVTYLSFLAAPADLSTQPLARFSEGVELLEVEVAPATDEALRVRLRWRATAPLAENYTVFLHYLRDGERIAQADALPAAGYYPTTAWRPGDVLLDDHLVQGVGAPLADRDALLFGLWQPESGSSLHLLDEAGNPAGEWMVLPVGEAGTAQ